MNRDQIEQISDTTGSSGRHVLTPRLMNGSTSYEVMDEVSLRPFSSETETSDEFSNGSKNKSSTYLPPDFCSQVVDEFLTEDRNDTKRGNNCLVTPCVKNPFKNIRQILSTGQKETVLADNNNSEINLDENLKAPGSWECSEYSSDVENSATPCSHNNKNAITVGFCESLHYICPSEMNLRVKGSISCEKSLDQPEEYSNLLKEGTLEHAFLGNVLKKRLVFQVISFKIDEAIKCVQVELSDGSEFSSNCIFGEDLTNQVENNINLWSIIEVLEYDIIADKFIEVKEFQVLQKLTHIIGDPDPIEDGLFLKIHRGDFRICTCVSDPSNYEKMDSEVSKRARNSPKKMSLKENQGDNNINNEPYSELEAENGQISLKNKEIVVRKNLSEGKQFKECYIKIMKVKIVPEFLKENVNETKQEQSRPRQVKSTPRHKCEYCDYEVVNTFQLKTHTDAEHKGIRYYCDQCPYEAKTKQNVLRHVESIHEGITYKCDQCPYEAKNKRNVRRHVESNHDVTMYKCDQCPYEAKARRNVQRHVESVHDRIRYKCDECDYEGKRKWNLKNHMEFFHYGINFKCDECDYQGTAKWYLKRHVEFIHNGNRFKCEHCEYKTINSGYLEKHIQFRHKDIA